MKMRMVSGTIPISRPLRFEKLKCRGLATKASMTLKRRKSGKTAILKMFFIAKIFFGFKIQNLLFRDSYLLLG